MTSYTKNNYRICKDNPNAPDVYAEVCADKKTTYSNNTKLAESQNTRTIPIAVIRLEASGYKCN